MPEPLDLDAIETRAAHLHEYGTLNDKPLQADLDQLTGTDVPAMAAEIRRLQAELAAEQSAHAFTLRQRNNRSHRLQHLRDLALTEDIDALLTAAKDTLAASVNDHTARTQPDADDCPGCDGTDTLPAWLAQRFDPNGAPWDALTDDDRAYWEHQARAVRRAVARGGFKTTADEPAARP